MPEDTGDNEILGPKTISIYYGRASDDNDKIMHLAIGQDGAPFSPSDRGVYDFFTQLGIGSPDLSRARLTVDSVDNVVTLSLQTADSATTKAQEDGVGIVTAQCKDETGATLEYRFSDSNLLHGLAQTHAEPLTVPAKDHYGTGDTEDKRYPITVHGFDINGREVEYILLPSSHLGEAIAYVDNPDAQAFRSFASQVVTKLYDDLFINDLANTQKGRYYLVALIDAAEQYPKAFDEVLKRFEAIGLDVGRVRKEYRAVSDNIRANLSDVTVRLSKAVKLSLRSQHGLQTTIDPRLATDFKEMDDSAFFDLIELLAQYEPRATQQPE